MSNRQEILDLLSQGRITAEEAAEMLSAPAVETAVPEKQPADTGHIPSWFKVRVRNLDTGKNKVSVNIPIRMFKFGMKIGRKFTDELDDLNWNEIDGLMKNMQTGMIVEVQDEESNEHVQVYFE